MIHVHELDGCAPTPLAHYLKALGILRLIAGQADENVRGWWEGDRFRRATGLTKEELEGFFLHEYRPTPMFNPWGARSGYFDGGVEVGQSDEPPFLAFTTIFGDGIRASAPALIAVAGLVASFHTIIHAYGRNIYSLSRSGYFPRRLSVTLPNRKTPYAALITGAVIDSDYRAGLYGCAVWFAAGLIYFALIGRT